MICFISLVQICDVTQQNQMNVDIFLFATNSVSRYLRGKYNFSKQIDILVSNYS